MIKQKELLIETFNIWKGNFDQTDDGLILGIRFNKTILSFAVRGKNVLFPADCNNAYCL